MGRGYLSPDLPRRARLYPISVEADTALRAALVLLPALVVRRLRRRVRQADELHEFAIAESLRDILIEEQDHLIALATALGIDPPDAGIAD